MGGTIERHKLLVSQHSVLHSDLKHGKNKNITIKNIFINKSASLKPL